MMFDIFGTRFIFGTYASGDYSPHFAWMKGFKCLPLLVGNLYITVAHKKV
jgi:hypothetical protein